MLVYVIESFPRNQFLEVLNHCTTPMKETQMAPSPIAIPEAIELQKRIIMKGY